jgi:hypothetical protein
MDVAPTRFISTTLTEAEWKALKLVQPDPARWLRDQVRIAIAQVNAIPGRPQGTDTAN